MRRCETSLIVFMLIALCLSILPPAQAQVEEPIQNFRVIQAFPDVMYAGSTYEARYLFDNVAGWAAPVAVNLTVQGSPSPGKGEFSVDMTLNGEPLACVEEPAHVFQSEEAFVDAASTDNSLVIRVSSAPNLQPGTYTVTMKLWSYKLDAEFTATPKTGAKPLTVQFTDTTLATVGSRLWSFGDGATSTEQNPTHTYTSEGTYTVSLNVTSDLATNTETKPNFIIVTAVQPATVTEAQIVGAQVGQVVSAPQAATTITVTTVGDVAVTVITYAENPHPVAMPEAAIHKYIDITVSNASAVTWPMHVEVTYTDAEVAGIDESSLGLYYWTAGAWHRCSSTGVLPATNTVWANMLQAELGGSPVLLGGSLPAPAPTPTWGAGVPANQLPVANAGSDKTAYVNQTVTFNGGASSDPDGAIVNYSWNFGDGTNGTGVIASHIYTAVGVYTVTLTVTDDRGGTDSGTCTATVRVPLAPAAFTLTNLAVSPMEVRVGETVTVTVDVSNIGEKAGSCTVTLIVNGAVEAAKTVTLGGGAIQTVSFTTSKAEAGTYSLEVDGLTASFTVTTFPPAPAAFELANLSVSPAEVRVGGLVTVTVDVSNVGELSGTYTVTLLVEGVAVASETVTLAGGEMKTVSFTVVEDVAGTYSVEIEGLTVSFTVTAPPPPTVMPPGYIAGIVAAVAAVAAGLLYYIRKVRPRSAQKVRSFQVGLSDFRLKLRIAPSGSQPPSRSG